MTPVFTHTSGAVASYTFLTLQLVLLTILKSAGKAHHTQFTMDHGVAVLFGLSDARQGSCRFTANCVHNYQSCINHCLQKLLGVFLFLNQTEIGDC